MADPHIKAILGAVERDALGRPMYYFISPQVNSYEASLLSKQRMTPIQASFDDFMEVLDSAVDADDRVLHAAIPPTQHSIERHFRRNVSAPPSIIAFLQNNVEHVHVGMISPPLTPETFYKGESQSWIPIEQGFDIERTSYSTLMLRTMALCQAEENSSAIALRGVAGAGKTVLLRRIAYDLATKYGHLVLFASPGAILRPEPLQELYELTGLRVVLAVDHVADQISALTVLLDALDRTSVPITVVVTDTHAALGNSLEALGDRLKFLSRPSQFA